MTDIQGNQHWQELHREIIFKAYSRAIEKRVYKMPDGAVENYYILAAGNGACTLALTEDNKVITVKEYRPGPDAVLYELPGGGYADNESMPGAAVREQLEETGYAGDAEAWEGSWLLDATTQSKRSVIIVKNCRKVAEPQHDTTEFIEVMLMDIPDFVAHVRSGQLTDAAGALLALDHLGLLTK